MTARSAQNINIMPWLRRKVRARRLSSRLALGFAMLGPAFAIGTSITLQRTNQGLIAPETVRIAFLIDLCYILVIAGLIIWRIAGLVIARRANSAGSRLHLRLTGIFTLMAVAPAVIVAIFSTITVNFGLEAWFSNQVGSVVHNSLETAQAYAIEHRQAIGGDALAMANDINRASPRLTSAAALENLVRKQAYVRELPEAYILNSSREITARGEFSFLYGYDPPTDDMMARARAGEVVIQADDANDEMRALIRLTGLFDAYLYVSRRVDGDVLRLLDKTRSTVALYEKLERDRNDIVFEFGLLYIGFALLVMLAAVLLGLWFADRMSRPIGKLAGAAQRIGAGDFSVRVNEDHGDDEISMLSRVFNRMTEQVDAQRTELVEANAETERRRMFIEAVLSGVTAGVIGLDAQGRVDLLNPSAAAMLNVEMDVAIGTPLAQIAPEFEAVFLQATCEPARISQRQEKMMVNGEEREFLVRVTSEASASDVKGYVLTFDDTTELVSAQRMAAWGDVARRIAHEIKNPLTPIQLSAERLRRKYSDKVGEAGRQSFEQYTDVIVRQADGIRRMVDEFSTFARMPAPQARSEELNAILGDALLLQKAAHPDIAYAYDAPAEPIVLSCDRGLLTQAITNLLQNAADAIQERRERDGGAPPPGRINVALGLECDGAVIRVADNGVGLPKTDRRRLMEPYMTTRQKGTGLGLAIVKKIVEQHHGEITLNDAPPFEPGGAVGALATVHLPLDALKVDQGSIFGSAISGAGKSPD